MHIAIVSQWYPDHNAPQISGGIEMHNYNFSRACTRLGHQVTIISTRRNPGAPFYQKTHENINIFRFRMPNLYRFRRIPIVGRQYRLAQAITYGYLSVRLLKQVNSQRLIDIAEFADIDAPALWWDKKSSRKLAIRCHAPNFVLSKFYMPAEIPYNVRLINRIEKQAIQKADFLTAPSQDLANLIANACRITSSKIHIVPNAVDSVESYRRIKPSQVVNVLFIGRLERLKGIETLIGVVPLVLTDPSMRMLIVGPDRRAYIKIIEERFRRQVTEKRLQLFGALYGDALEKVYQSADICIVPSLYESFSYTVAQAMMRGIPVIASRVGGIPETLNGGRCGILVEPNNPEELAEAILNLAQNPAKRAHLGEAAREYAVSKFSSDVVARQITDLYEELLK